MKKIQLSIIGIFLTAVVFAQGNWELIYEQEGNGGLLINNLSSSGVEWDVFVSGRRKNSFTAHHVSKVNQWTKDQKWAQGFLELTINSQDAPQDIFMLDETNIWVCGYRGMISHSDGRGVSRSWNVQPTPANDLFLESIWFTDKNNGWAVGRSAAVLHTTNGGKSWDKVNAPVDMFFSRVFFIDKNNGYILATQKGVDNLGVVLKTSNGGTSWTVHKFKTNSQVNNGMFFYDSQNGWICGDKGFITHTSDGGKTWTKQQWTHSDKWQLNDIHFASLNEGWTCGDRGELYHTTDGGGNWTKIDIGETRDFTAMEFNGHYLGWIATARKIYQYKDPRFENYQKEYKKNGLPKTKTSSVQENITKPKSKPKLSILSTTNAVAFNLIQKGRSWEIRSYKNSIYDLNKALNQIQKEGFMPVGLNLAGNRMEVFVNHSQPFICSNWSLKRYGNTDELSMGISTMIESGYLPLGMALVENSFNVIFAKTKYIGHGWQIVESELDHQDVSNDIQSYLEDGYIPVGISLFAGYYYTLLIQHNEFPVNNWSLRGYNFSPETQMKNEINKEGSNNMLPFGFFKDGYLVNILYLGF